MIDAEKRTRINRLARLAVWAPVFLAAVGGSIVDVSAQAPAATPVPTQPQPTIKKPKAPTAARNPINSPLAEANQPSTQKSASAIGGETIARVGTAEIKEDELRAVIAALGEREQAALTRDPALLSQVVRQLLANQLVLKEALAKRWEERPDVVQQLRRAREASIAESFLRSVSQPPADFPEDSMIQNAYDANRSAFLVPRQFLIAQIFVALPADADKTVAAKASKKIADIQLKLKQPNADFAAIAGAESDAKEASDHGGEIGWVSEAQLRPEIRTLVLGLAKNAVSEVAKLDDGWHFVKLIDTKAAYTRPLDEVRAELVVRLRNEQAAAMRRNYMAELLKRTPLAINELALARMVSESNQVLPR